MGLIAPAREHGKTMGKRPNDSRQVLDSITLQKSHGAAFGLLHGVDAMTQSPGLGREQHEMDLG